MDDFCKKLAEILELDEVTASDVLENFPEWDSLSVLSVVAMIDAQYRVNLTAADLRTVRTAQSLYELVDGKRNK
jgi:acyl carrier protein